MPRNAITMRGTVEECWLLALRVDPTRVEPLLPRPLRLVEYGGYAFFNVVVSRLGHMRPAPLPAWTGIGYWHVAYRLYARFEDTEGLYFLRSDADSSLMVAMGNLLTDFRFHRARIGVEHGDGESSLVSHSPGAELRLRLLDEAPSLAPGSPFADLGHAETFLKYKPVAIAAHDGRVDLLRITRDEAAWQSRLRGFRVEELEFLEPYGAAPEVLYEMRPIEYQWNRAERHRVNP
jgi:uncharacterized protein YqjF (DUF2071 family)